MEGGKGGGLMCVRSTSLKGHRMIPRSTSGTAARGREDSLTKHNGDEPEVCNVRRGSEECARPSDAAEITVGRQCNRAP